MRTKGEIVWESKATRNADVLLPLYGAEIKKLEHSP